MHIFLFVPHSVFLEIKGDAVLECTCENIQHAVPKHAWLKCAFYTQDMTKINVRGDCPVGKWEYAP